VAGGGTLAALPIPLGSLTELFVPPALPGPAGTPLTPVVPAPAEPAFGVPIALPDAAPPAVVPPAPVPCAKTLTGASSAEATAIANIGKLSLRVLFRNKNWLATNTNQGRFSNRADAVRYLDELVVRSEGRRSRNELDERWWKCEARLVTRYTVCARNHG
jgi:hypothetical protein